MKLLPAQVVVEMPREDRRRRGRPSVGEAQARFQLPADVYDAAYRIASRDRLDINDVFRRAVREHVLNELKSAPEPAVSQPTE